MKFKQTDLPGVIVIEPAVYQDKRGSFFEGYNRDLFFKNGITVDFIQDNHSLSKKGVVRGLHYQRAPHAQAKLLRVVRGEAFDVVVDVRRDSGTFGKWIGEVLSAENRRMVYVPAGFAHGFCALKDDTEFFYKVSAPYSPADEAGVFWDDPAIGIRWPRIDAPFILSEKDTTHPLLKDALTEVCR